MRTICRREFFKKKCRQQQSFDSDPEGAWHYNHVTFTSIAKNFMLYCRLIHMLSMLFVRLTIKVKLGIPESFKLGWYPPKITGSSHLKQFQINPKKRTSKGPMASALALQCFTNFSRVNLQLLNCNYHCGDHIFI